MRGSRWCLSGTPAAQDSLGASCSQGTQAVFFFGSSHQGRSRIESGSSGPSSGSSSSIHMLTAKTFYAGKRAVFLFLSRDLEAHYFCTKKGCKCCSLHYRFDIETSLCKKCGLPRGIDGSRCTCGVLVGVSLCQDTPRCSIAATSQPRPHQLTGEQRLVGPGFSGFQPYQEVRLPWCRKGGTRLGVTPGSVSRV